MPRRGVRTRRRRARGGAPRACVSLEPQQRVGSAGCRRPALCELHTGALQQMGCFTSGLLAYLLMGSACWAEDAPECVHRVVMVPMQRILLLCDR